jgi:hypothetical protein
MTCARCALCIAASLIQLRSSLTPAAHHTVVHCVICEYCLLYSPSFPLCLATDLDNDRTKEFLSRTIQQGGGSEGHSSVEDSVASLDLVKWFVLNKKTKPVIVPVGARARGAGEGGGSGGWGWGSGSGDGVAPTTKI